MRIHKKNIRATTLKEFWGNEFDESIYLWEGAKHNLTLSEIEKTEIPTYADLFFTKENAKNAHEYCKKIYSKLLPLLTTKLNEIHGLYLPVSFWRAVFGFWLYRHICIVYEKYSYLVELNIDQTSIKLLDKESFYTPNVHYDYVYCFGSDFGVQQLVSHYYYMYANKKFPNISMLYNMATEKHELNHAVNLIIEKNDGVGQDTQAECCTQVENDPKVAICCAYFPKNILNVLNDKSKGEIQWMDIPKIKIYETPINSEKRKKLIDLDTQCEFEKFLLQTLYYCLPKILIEYFKKYYDCFFKNIRKKSFSHIVSEVWMSFLPTSIYLAIAQYEGRKLIFQQHGASTQWGITNPDWMELSVADKYITTGWKSNNKKIVQGGFSCRAFETYQYEAWKKNILYISCTRFKYLYSYENLVANKKMIDYLKSVREFIELLPDHLYKNFVLRPRTEKHFWNTEYALEIKKKKIKIATGVFSDIISESKIVIIDHLSTGVAEILANKIPCLIIHNNEREPLSDEYATLFDGLIQCGVVHESVSSAVQQLLKISDNVEQWWSEESVQHAVECLVEKNLGPPSKTVDYLLSCLE